MKSSFMKLNHVSTFSGKGQSITINLEGQLGVKICKYSLKSGCDSEFFIEPRSSS